MAVKGQANRPKNGKPAASVRPEQTSASLKVRPRQPNAGYRGETARSSKQAPGKQSPISGVGVFVGVLLVAALIAWFAMASNQSSAGTIDESKLPKMVQGANAPAQGALEAKAVTAPLVNGVQAVDFVVIGDSMSYRPNVIKVKQGMPVRFNVSVEGRDPG